MRRISAQRTDGAPPAARSPLARLEDFATSANLTVSAPELRRIIAIVRRFVWGQRLQRSDQVTTTAVEQYLGALAGRGRSEKTLRNHLSAISRFCDFLRRRQVLAKNPCRDVKLRKPMEVLPRFLDVDEIAVVLLTARACGIWPEVCLALATGLRMGELARLCWPDVDLERRCLTVRRSKSRRPRIVPLSEPALKALAEQRRKIGSTGLKPVPTYVFPARRTWRGGWRYQDKPRDSSQWGRSLRPIQDAVPKFRSAPGRSTGRGWHLFRHTFASRAVQAGVSLYKLASWLGHSDVRTTAIYAHLQTGYDGDIEKASPANDKGERR